MSYYEYLCHENVKFILTTRISDLGQYCRKTTKPLLLEKAISSYLSFSVFFNKIGTNNDNLKTPTPLEQKYFFLIFYVNLFLIFS